MAKASLLFFVAVVIGLAIIKANAQVPDLCPGQPKIPNGFGYECVPQQQIPQQYTPQPEVAFPQYNAPAPPTPQENAVIQEFENLGAGLAGKVQSLYGGGTLSNELNQQQPNPVANVKPPPGFFDPFPPAANVPPLPPGYSPFTRQPEIGTLQPVPPPPVDSSQPQPLPPPGKLGTQNNNCYVNPATSQFVCGTTFQNQ